MQVGVPYASANQDIVWTTCKNSYDAGSLGASMKALRASVRRHLYAEAAFGLR